MYYERIIEPTIKKINETFPVLIVTGPRQVGKTTLLTRMAEKERKIVSLDNPMIRALAKSDPELFIQRYALPVLIDEIQYAPGLFDYIKIYVDREKRCGDFWLTGSQTFRMMKHVTESLAGRAGIVALIQPYFNNALKRVIKAPRMYFLDTGLCAHLTRWSSEETLEAGAMSGEFFETWVVSEICKSYLNAGKRPPLYFYRDSNKKEIDVIIYQDGTVTPAEIKKSSAPEKAVRNFSVLNPIEREPVEEDAFSGAAHLKVRIGTGAVICMSSDLIPIDKKNWYIPAWLI